MASSIISLLDQYPETIRNLIDQTFKLTSTSGQKYSMGLPDPALARFLPQNRYVSPKLAIAKLAQRRPTIASIVGVDGEYPLRREPVLLSVETVGSVKLALARLFTEEDFDLLKEAELYLAANQRDVYDAFVAQYIQSPAILTQSVTTLASLLLTQLFTSGTSIYIDPETKLGFELSYLSQIPSVNRPAALAGADLWSNPLTATPLINLRDHLNNKYKNNYSLPDAIVMGSTVADYMLNAADTRNRVSQFMGKGSSTDVNVQMGLSRPTIEDVRLWLASEMTTGAQGTARVPEMIVSDAVYYSVDSSGNVNASGTPFVPSDGYYFFSEGIVEGAYVPTATNDYASTMALITELVSRAPKKEKASIDTRFLALCTEPRQLGWRKVI